MVERPRVEITSRQQWRGWLAQHHATSTGVWVVTYKRAAGERHVPYEHLVLEALCFGWVDSQARGVDEERTSITMTPRREGSRWTQPNRDRVAMLEQAGLMEPAGLAAVAAARASGAWDELRDVEALVEPADLTAALDAVPGSRQRWEGRSRSARYADLLRLHDAKRPATRARTIERIVGR